MSPELERLLSALWERDTCEPKDLPSLIGSFDYWTNR